MPLPNGEKSKHLVAGVFLSVTGKLKVQWGTSICGNQSLVNHQCSSGNVLINFCGRRGLFRGQFLHIFRHEMKGCCLKLTLHPIRIFFSGTFSVYMSSMLCIPPEL
ncbi:hypothetical protein GOODEAATRI_018691 [Goodea atripinnis]|uniref:Uncharacterized protein n=1 Tax=Goodea atripinnis TaxID=208336 RepID=A0ABV0PFD8_9TELE